MAAVLATMIMILKIMGCAVLITLAAAVILVILKCTFAVLFDIQPKK